MLKKNKKLLFLIAVTMCLAVILTGCRSSKNSTSAPTGLWLTMPDKSVLLQKQTIPSSKLSQDNLQLTINTSTVYQEMDGFGYTLSGGSAMHIAKMSAPARAKFLQEIYGTNPEDLQSSYIRISVGASDLDEKIFSYNDLPSGETDVNMEKFDLNYDKLYLIPVLQQILKINPSIKILGSPWSPPVWMKTNGDTRGGSLKTEYYPAYAKYIVKYVQEMKKNGIVIDALTIQNEPLHPGNNPSLLMVAEDQKVFVRDYLGPEFKKNSIKTKIIIYDHNADRPDYPITILNDKEAAQYIDGSAFHLYGGSVDAISKVHEAHPNKNLYFTEQWVGAPGDFAKELTWHIENLIIGAPNNWCKTVLEWNLAADENQNPHTDRGGCTSCLGAVTITGDTVTREPAYYIIAHASKFVPPGSVRVQSSIIDKVPNVAYKTPEGNTVVIIQNTSNEVKAIDVHAGSKNTSILLKSGAVATLVM